MSLGAFLMMAGAPVFQVTAGAWVIFEAPSSFYNAQGYADSTIADSGGSTRGSISPAAWNGNDILAVYTREVALSSELRLFIIMDGTVAQSAFTTLVTELGDFDTASATYSAAGGVSSWSWFTGGSTQLSSSVVTIR